MAEDSIALQKQQLLVNVTGQGDFSASEANCAMALLVSTQLPNRMADICQSQPGWCGPSFNHALHHGERWLLAQAKTELQVLLSVQQPWRLSSSSWACVLALCSMPVRTWWICPVTSKHIWIVTYSSSSSKYVSSISFLGSFHLLQTGL